VPLSPGIRRIFEGVPERVARSLIGGRSVRVALDGGALYIFARNFEEMILVEPRISPGGEPRLAYAVRDRTALADLLDRRLGIPKRKEPNGEYRRSKPRRLGRAGSIA
jgi:hypothetical protein